MMMVLHPPELSRMLFRTGDGGISARQVLARADALARRLPAGDTAYIFHESRDYFVVAMLAAWRRGAVAVLPADTGMRGLEFPTAEAAGRYVLSERPPATRPALPCVVGETVAAPGVGAPIPSIAADMTAIRIFTSGSTGAPVANDKSWRMLAEGTPPTARMIGLAALSSPSLVATVPAQHMYGLEISVLQVLLAGASVHVERPVYPADIARCLQDVPAPRVLVTTPFHLRGIVESDCAFPPVARVISATAPLSAAFAAAAERRLGAQVHEIYGFTEIGSVATRHTVRQQDWTIRDDLDAVPDGDGMAVEWAAAGVRLPFPDLVESVGEGRIRLLGRNQDIVKIAGKRASLPGLSAQLLGIDGVEDGVLALLAEDEGVGLVSRLAAFVVAPALSDDQIRQALRRSIDPVFFPRYIFHVTSLPRNETGKLRHDELQKLAAEKLCRG